MGVPTGKYRGDAVTKTLPGRAALVAKSDRVTAEALDIVDVVRKTAEEMGRTPAQGTSVEELR
jgi:aryl-alcohol dehydrogenase-like predicted oxidoreductase